MTTYAISRDYDDGDSFPYVHNNKYEDKDVKYHPCDDTHYECWQPDELDYAEFNVAILLNGSPILVRGIHFDFVEKED